MSGPSEPLSESCRKRSAPTLDGFSVEVLHEFERFPGARAFELATADAGMARAWESRGAPSCSPARALGSGHRPRCLGHITAIMQPNPDSLGAHPRGNHHLDRHRQTEAEHRDKEDPHPPQEPAKKPASHLSSPQATRPA